MKTWAVAMLMLIATISCGEDELRVDKFSVMAKFEDSTLSVWLDTDLPDDAMVRIYVERTFDLLVTREGDANYRDTTAAYVFDVSMGHWRNSYLVPDRRVPNRPVSQWKRPLAGAFDENEWLVSLTGLRGLRLPVILSNSNENEWVTYLKQNLDKGQTQRRILAVSDKIEVSAAYSHDRDVPAMSGMSTAECGLFSCHSEVVLHIPTDPSVVAALITPNFDNGKHEVGRDISPGTYESLLNRSCYWERLRGFSGSFSDVITNGSGSGKLVVEIVNGDKAFVSQGCNPWVLVP